VNPLGVPAAHRLVTITAAALTTAVAVGADLIASRHPMHTVTLALVGGVVALTRVVLLGRHRTLFAAVSGAVVAQPVLHAAMKVLPAAADRAPGALHAANEAAVTVMHVLLTTVVVVAVAGAEHMLLLAALLRPRAGRLRLSNHTPVRSTLGAPPAPPVQAPAVRRSRVENLPRRGPPAPRTSFAV
jgi:hypothetical protein